MLNDLTKENFIASQLKETQTFTKTICIFFVFFYPAFIL